MKDNFSKQATAYAKYRPVYPLELFEFIFALVQQKELAWDCGTGNGQTAIVLSKYFHHVYATDISKTQIENAIKEPNIQYEVEQAEQASLKNGTVDLVTISQALHWFDFDIFYREVKRVSKPEGIIAAWTYSLFKTDPTTDKIIRDYHYGILEPYWDKERAYVDNEYATIPFPFETLNVPEFFIKVNWNLKQLEGYLDTWSALQKFIVQNNYNPLPELIGRIKMHWPRNEERSVIFPVHLKIGRVF